MLYTKLGIIKNALPPPVWTPPSFIIGHYSYKNVRMVIIIIIRNKKKELEAPVSPKGEFMTYYRHYDSESTVFVFLSAIGIFPNVCIYTIHVDVFPLPHLYGIYYIYTYPVYTVYRVHVYFIERSPHRSNTLIYGTV